jgi:hypothetical protein
MIDPIQDIIDSTNEWGGWGHQNSQLELASLALEAKKAGLAYDRLGHTWEKQRDSTRLKRGIFRRSPKGYHSHDMSNSHDNAVGIAVNSWLFDHGETAKEILDEGLTFGLWLTGPNEKGRWLCGEWFTFWWPQHRAIMKLAAGRKITALEDLFLRANLLFATSWNMKRVRILFLESIGYDLPFLDKVSREMGDRFKGRYGENPLYLNLWRLQDD